MIGSFFQVFKKRTNTHFDKMLVSSDTDSSRVFLHEKSDQDDVCFCRDFAILMNATFNGLNIRLIKMEYTQVCPGYPYSFDPYPERTVPVLKSIE